MANYIEPIGKLINCFSKLPGVGNKTAGRYAYHIINMTKEEAEEFAQGILDVKNKVSFCSVCGNYTDVDPCVNCQNNKSDIVVVVAEPKDVSVIEKVKNFPAIINLVSILATSASYEETLEAEIIKRPKYMSPYACNFALVGKKVSISVLN